LAVCDEELAVEGMGVCTVIIVVDLAAVVVLTAVLDLTSCAPQALSSSFSQSTRVFRWNTFGRSEASLTIRSSQTEIPDIVLSADFILPKESICWKEPFRNELRELREPKELREFKEFANMDPVEGGWKLVLVFFFRFRRNDRDPGADGVSEPTEDSL